MIPDGDMDLRAISEPFELMVAECDTTSCGEAQPIDVGWETLWAWGIREDLRLLGTPDGGFILPQYWSPGACDFLYEVTRVNVEAQTADAVGSPRSGMVDAAAVTDDGEPRVLFVDEDGEFRMINLNEVTPSGTGPVVSKCATP